MSASSLLKLLYLVSPALPVGAYAYSQGQEFAIEGGWLDTQEKLEEWIFGLMRFGLANLDLPCLIRLYKAWEDDDKKNVEYWNLYLLASRESAELLLEDEQMGLAMSRLLDTLKLDKVKPSEPISDSLKLDIISGQSLKSENFNETNFNEVSLNGANVEKHTLGHHSLSLTGPVSYTTLFAYCGVAWSIPINDLLQGFVAAWLENQVAAATKTIPLGQSQAQTLILKLHEAIPGAVNHAFSVEDENIGASLPGLAMASAKHERQYSRLFRS